MKDFTGIALLIVPTSVLLAYFMVRVVMGQKDKVYLVIMNTTSLIVLFARLLGR